MSLKSLIKLAENPEFDDLDAFGEDDDYGDEFGDEMGDDEFGDDEFGGAEDEMDDLAFKGKRVSGPRTKLASADSTSIEAMMKSVGLLAKSVNAIAKVQKAMLDKSGWNDDQDPMDPEDEDDLETLDLAKASKAKVSKDDTASTFGEKNSTTPGNRPYDQTSPGEEDTVINSSPAAGPGPVSKSSDKLTPELTRTINRAVRQALSAAGVSQINKAEAPGVGSQSKIDKSVNVVDLQRQLQGRSFKDINALRVAEGDLPAGIL